MGFVFFFLQRRIRRTILELNWKQYAQELFFFIEIEQKDDLKEKKSNKKWNNKIAKARRCVCSYTGWVYFQSETEPYLVSIASHKIFVSNWKHSPGILRLEINFISIALEFIMVLCVPGDGKWRCLKL